MAKTRILSGFGTPQAPKLDLNPAEPNRVEWCRDCPALIAQAGGCSREASFAWFSPVTCSFGLRVSGRCEDLYIEDFGTGLGDVEFQVQRGLQDLGCVGVLLWPLRNPSLLYPQASEGLCIEFLAPGIWNTALKTQVPD